MTTTTQETHGFQAEVKQLLNLMIHSLYTNKEIFLRELISNASDAADKLRFEALTDKALYESDSGAEDPRVAIDPKARTITVSDNGIGMSRDEVIDNIGTIAKSGTREFFDELTGDQPKDAHLIGQFGVGFYSSFIVADKVTVVTRRAGLTAEHGVRWESDGGGEYTIEAVEKASTRHRSHAASARRRRRARSTVPAALASSASTPTTSRSPIVMKKEEWDKDKRDTASPDEDETVNQASALWARPKNEITEEQYHEFYKHVAHDFEAAARLHAQQGRRHQGIHAAPLHPGARAVRPVGPRAPARHQALRAARVHHGRRRAADAGLSALRARRDRLERSAAQRLARDPAGIARTSR